MVVHLNWAVHVNVFPLIGSQKRFITRGEYGSEMQATEKIYIHLRFNKLNKLRLAA